MATDTAALKQNTADVTHSVHFPLEPAYTPPSEEREGLVVSKLGSQLHTIVLLLS